MLAAGALRRRLGGWRAVGRRLARPPIEVWFLLPFGILLAIVAASGNPLVARAVRWIAAAGVVLAWLSGVVLDAARDRGPLRLRGTLVHVLLVVIAAGAAVYLIVGGLGLLDLVGETWRGGPALP